MIRNALLSHRRSVQEAAHVDGDIAGAVAESDSVAKDLTTALFGSASRLQQTLCLNLLEDPS